MRVSFCLAAASLITFSIHTSILSQDLEEGLKSLSDQIVTGMAESKKQKIAVVEFSDLDGRITELGKFLSEELITRLFLSRKFDVVERQLLNKVLEEHRLNISGLIDETTAKKLGRILGVDAICSGTITDLINTVKLNSRLISTETGAIFAVASTNIQKDEVISKLLGKVSYYTQTTPSGTIKQSVLPGKILFFDDFSSYEEGDPTDWGQNVYVKRLKDGRKYLVTSLRGKHTVGKNINLPKNFYLQFDFVEWANETYISFVDSRGAKYSVEWDTNGNYFTLPDGTKTPDRMDRDYKTFRINVENDVVKIYLDGQFMISGVMKGFSNLVRFEIVIPYSQFGHHVFITNVKVGEM